MPVNSEGYQFQAQLNFYKVKIILAHFVTKIRIGPGKFLSDMSQFLLHPAFHGNNQGITGNPA